MALRPVHPQLARRRGFVSGTRSAGILRDRSALGEPFRTDNRGRPAKASPEASSHVASGRGLSEIDGRMVYLWRAVDAEGEVLDVLVQSKRNKQAALKLMRKLLKKYAIVPERMITDDLRSYSAAFGSLGSNATMSAGAGRTTEQRIRISRHDDGAQDAAVQEPRFSPEISFHPRRRLQHYQSPTPSHLGSHAPDAPRCGDEHVAGGGRSGVRIPTANG
jgi:hypothetical protein